MGKGREGCACDDEHCTDAMVKYLTVSEGINTEKKVLTHAFGAVILMVGLFGLMGGGSSCKAEFGVMPRQGTFVDRWATNTTFYKCVAADAFEQCKSVQEGCKEEKNPVL